MVCFEVLFRYSPVEIEENRGICQDSSKQAELRTGYLQNICVFIYLSGIRQKRV